MKKREIVMLNFKFEMGGIPALIEAKNKLEAMTRANRFYCDLVERGEIELTQGAWMETAGLQSYCWAEGNFFD